MKKALLATVGLLFMLIATACSGNSSEEIAEQDIKDMVEEYSVGSFEGVSASITSQELIVTNTNLKQITYDLPEDEFFVSIAPFVKTTHPCAIHSLTGCQGELVEQKFDVYIQDEEGNVIIDESMESLANGFIDFWLPRNKTFQVKIEHNGKTAMSEISTFEGDNTCITTMQLM